MFKLKTVSYTHLASAGGKPKKIKNGIVSKEPPPPKVLTKPETIPTIKIKTICPKFTVQPQLDNIFVY